MNTFNPSIFRAYDIRGKAAKDLSNELSYHLGRAFASELAQPNPTVSLARDCRLSSKRIRDSFAKGLCDSGANVIDVGVGPSPILYFAAHHLNTSGSVVITGSHNPSDENGFKMMRGTSSFYGDAIKKLKLRINGENYVEPTKTGVIKEQNIDDAYLNAMQNALNMGKKRPKVVIDAGNGTGGPLAIKLFGGLGFDVIPLFCEMDGTFPNHHPDPTVESNLQALKDKVIESGAEVGLAFDGDTDRLGAIDGSGRVLWGDQLMIIFGRAILKEIPGAKFIGEVKCSQSMYDELKKAGGHPIMWKVGHSLIKSKLKEEKASLAGEMSGHLFFADRYFGFDDAIYAGARLLEILSKSPMTLSEHFDTLPSMVNTPEIRVPCPDDRKFELVDAVATRLKASDKFTDIVELDGVRANMGFGWGLVRASNTQPSLVTRYEASSTKELKTVKDFFIEAISTSKLELSIP